jgi:hypothetical protein
MARGGRRKEKKDDIDSDILEYLPTLLALSRPQTVIEPNSPVLEISAVSFARVAEAAVEQHVRSLRRGSISEYRRRARRLIEGVLGEERFHSGRRHELQRLGDDGLLSADTIKEGLQSVEERERVIWRLAAGDAAEILRDIKARKERIGKKGRAAGSGTTDKLLRRQDTEILKEAAAHAASKTRAGIAAAIPPIVRERLRRGQLRTLGTTTQEAVDRHSKRLRAVLKRTFAHYSDGVDRQA